MFILPIEEPIILIVSSSEKRGLLFLHLLFPLLINAVSVSNKLFARLLETVSEFIKNYFLSFGRKYKQNGAIIIRLIAPYHGCSDIKRYQFMCVLCIYFFYKTHSFLVFFPQRYNIKSRLSSVS